MRRGVEAPPHEEREPRERRPRGDGDDDLLGDARARLRVLALETRLGTRYTADTLERLGRWPGFRFVWLMGADNLAQLPRWRHWRHILAACPVAVFERQPYSYAALAGPVARGFGAARVPEQQAGTLVGSPLPAWTFVRLRPHPASATAIRARTEAGGG